MKKQARKAKREYERRLARKIRHNKRAFFRYVNSKLGQIWQYFGRQTAKNGFFQKKSFEPCFWSKMTYKWNGASLI